MIWELRPSPVQDFIKWSNLDEPQLGVNGSELVHHRSAFIRIDQLGASRLIKERLIGLGGIPWRRE